MHYWDKILREQIFVNHKGVEVVQIQRLGRSTSVAAAGLTRIIEPLSFALKAALAVIFLIFKACPAIPLFEFK